MSKNFYIYDENTFKSDDDVMSKLEPRVSEEIIRSMIDYRYGFIEAMCGCESPIEQLLTVALVRILDNYYFELRDLDVYGVVNQAEIVSDGKTYRVDMSIAVENKITHKMNRFVIECDGHEFHEKSKSQAAKDKARERALTKEGRTVIRFSGSEIYKSPGACAMEVRDIITKRCQGDE